TWPDTPGVASPWPTATSPKARSTPAASVPCAPAPYEPGGGKRFRSRSRAGRAEGRLLGVDAGQVCVELGQGERLAGVGYPGLQPLLDVFQGGTPRRLLGDT